MTFKNSVETIAKRIINLMSIIAITRGKKIKKPVSKNNTFIIYSNSLMFTEKDKVDSPCKTLLKFYN